MVNLLAILLTAALTLFSTQSHAQSVTTSLDRTEIVRGETVTLTLRVDGQQGGVQMDLKPLETNFQVVATRTSSQMRSVNNRTESWIDYHLTLFPLREGTLEIPSLLVDGELTPALSINVLPKTQTSIGDQELFLETIVSKDNVYVQEQLLFTIRLYYTINGIRNPIFTELNMPDTVIQMIGTPNQYEKLVDGKRYGVYEKQYAIFPQRSGSLTIPDIMFRGEVTDGSSNYVFRNLNTRAITSFAEGSEIKVKEKPANYPENAVWLPASNLTIKEEWDNDFTNVRVGDAVNRKITVDAFGLDGAALPPLQLAAVDTVNTYPEAPSILRTYIDGNIMGTRIEDSSMVMTATGTIRVPGVTLPWFDIDTEEVKYAIVEDSAIRVGPVRSAPNQINSIQDMSQESSDQLTGRSTTINDSNESDLISVPRTPLWIIVLAAALTALLFSYVYYNGRRRKTAAASKKSYAVSAPMYAQAIDPAAETVAFKELVRASEKNHLPALRLALIGWGRQYFRDSDLHNLDELAQRTGNAEIGTLCLKVQQALYGKTDASIDLQSDSKRLVLLVGELRDARNKTLADETKEQDYTLPPLYKT